MRKKSRAFTTILFQQRLATDIVEA